jgi:nucleotide-binding universal stress UspA family protein
MEKILAAVDGSFASNQALKIASVLAKSFKSSLTLLHVMEFKKIMLLHDDFTGGWISYLNETAERLHKKGEKILDEAKQGLNVEVIPRLELGNPAEIICDTAKEEDFDLITMGSRGLSDFGGILLGSVSHQVLERSSVPVLITKSGEEKEDRRGPAFKKILAAVDGSRGSKTALLYAANLAHQLPLELIILHAIPDIRYTPYYLETFAVEAADTILQDELNRLKEKGIQVLQDAEKSISDFKISIKKRMETGDPSKIINRVAAEENVDLIVMGTKGPSEWLSLVSSGTSHRTLEISTRPILFVKETIAHLAAVGAKS